MRITDLSKDELLYVISNIGFIHDEKKLLRIGLRFRANSLFEQGQAQHNIATHKLKKYMELLSPYSGQKLADIPIEIIKDSKKHGMNINIIRKRVQSFTIKAVPYGNK